MLTLQRTPSQIEVMEKELNEYRKIIEEGRKVIDRGKPIFLPLKECVDSEGNVNYLKLGVKIPHIIRVAQKDETAIKDLIKFLETLGKL